MKPVREVPWLATLTLAAMLAGAMASMGWAQSRQKYPPAPKEVLDEFVRAARQTPEYRWYSELPADEMKERVGKWQEDLKYQLNAHYRPFWELLLGWNQPVEMPDAAAGQLRYQNQGSRRSVVTLDITKYQMGSGGAGPQRISETYLVQGADLGELNSMVLDGIAVRDPLATPVEHFAAQGEPLSVLFKRLCAMGQVSSAYRQDLADKTTITLDLRGKTVLGCLTVLARTAGGQAMVLPSGSREPMSVEKVSTEHVINIDNLRQQQAEALATQPTASQPSPAEILRNAVQDRVESVRKDRPVVLLQLPAAGE